MKKVISILALCLMALSAMAQEETKVVEINEVRVSTAAEFIRALHDNTTIIVCADEINLTEAIPDAIDEGLIWAGGYSTVDSDTEVEPGLYYYDPFDGPNLCLVNVNNLTIKGDGKVSRILVSPRYADVITFARCLGVKLENVTMGHTDSGYCENGVVSFNGCYDVEIQNCDLFGCGTEGVILDGTQKFYCNNTVIHDCEYDLMTIKGSYDVVFDNCTLQDTGTDFSSIGVGEVNIYGGQDGIEFRRCTFKNNAGMLFSVESDIILNGCKIHHPKNMIGDVEHINMIDTTISE